MRQSRDLVCDLLHDSPGVLVWGIRKTEEWLVLGRKVVDEEIRATPAPRLINGEIGEFLVSRNLIYT